MHPYRSAWLTTLALLVAAACLPARDFADDRARVRAALDARRRAGRETRIAVIGAGASGLTAVHALQEKGFRNLTLYEAGDRIGGKVHSVRIDGHGIELGAVLGMRDNDTLYDMARELGVLRLEPAPHRFLVLTRNGDGSWKEVGLDRYWGGRSALQVARGLLRFTRILWSPRFRPVFRPGFHDLHEDLVGLTMDRFARKHGFEAILEPFHVVLYASGYGSMDEIPALYFLKMMRAVEKVRVRRQVSFGVNPGVHVFAGGYQQLWEGVARHLVANGLDLRLGSRVTAVTRGSGDDGETVIRVRANGETRTFDRLLVTTLPHETLQFLDVTAEERELFSKVSTFDYHTVVFRAAGLHVNAFVNLRDHMTHARDGHLFTYYHDDPGSDLYTGFQFLGPGQDPAELDRLLGDDVDGLGGELTGIVLRKGWKYFPHVRPENLDPSYYPRLNALQGRLGTYYLGGIFAFETTDHCAQFARFLVDHY